MPFIHSLFQAQQNVTDRILKRITLFCLTVLSICLVGMPTQLYAEPMPEKKPFLVAISGGTGYSYEAHQAYFGDIRIAISVRSYLKFGYRKHMVNTDDDPREYTVLAGFMTTPKPGRSTRGYIEVGAGYGTGQGWTSSDVLFEAQGGALILFGEGGTLGLDLGLFFVGNIFKEDNSRGKILGAQAGLVVTFGPKPKQS